MKKMQLFYRRGFDIREKERGSSHRLIFICFYVCRLYLYWIRFYSL